jgi:hypothetical protein
MEAPTRGPSRRHGLALAIATCEGEEDGHDHDRWSHGRHLRRARPGPAELDSDAAPEAIDGVSAQPMFAKSWGRYRRISCCNLSVSRTFVARCAFGHRAGGRPTRAPTPRASSEAGPCCVALARRTACRSDASTWSRARGVRADFTPCCSSAAPTSAARRLDCRQFRRTRAVHHQRDAARSGWT